MTLGPLSRRVAASFLSIFLLGPLRGEGGPSADQPATPKHLEWATRLLADVRPGTTTTYRHKKTSVRWRGVNGAAASECHTDCSGDAHCQTCWHGDWSAGGASSRWSERFGSRSSFKSWSGNEEVLRLSWEDASGARALRGHTVIDA
jgi:hypothetical protein